jgi:predicted AlkP superfamily pyrophosphatase or phosphodiesterase
MYLRTLGLIAAFGAKALAHDNDKVYKYVAAFSIDGFHSSDVGKYVALRPQSTIASLLETGYEYTDAFTSAPSDSYPGVMNFVTGSSPRTTGMIIQVLKPVLRLT